ncbi:MAG: hypothetical protein IPH45_18885 [Bacteroidales bacterium]|nr:hypothetical protein [Bacteroidales bacterium]
MLSHKGFFYYQINKGFSSKIPTKEAKQELAEETTKGITEKKRKENWAKGSSQEVRNLNKPSSYVTGANAQKTNISLTTL